MNLLGGSFVEKVRQHWWPQYSWQKFFWFNASYFVIMIASVVAYDLRGGSWLILPLAWVIERLCNGFWHVWWTIPRILAGSGKQHPHLDGLVFHRPLPTSRGGHRATNFMGRSPHWIARCRFSGVLYSAGKGQDDASQGVKCKWHLRVFRGRD